MLTTLPAPGLLRCIRANIGKINTVAHAAVEALDRGPADLAATLDAIAALHDAQVTIADLAVTAMLHAAAHDDAAVRVAAAEAMAAHPYGVVIRCLTELLDDSLWGWIQRAILR